MKIKKTSWHYRFLELMGYKWDMPRTLCSYFWTVVLFAPIRLICAIMFFGSLIMVTVGTPIVSIIDCFYPFLNLGMLEATNIILITQISAAIIYLFIRVVDSLGSYNYDNKGLIRSYIDSKKRKICPFIDFE